MIVDQQNLNCLFPDSGIYRLLFDGMRRHHYGKPTAYRARLMPEVAAKASHSRAREVAAEAGRLRLRLEPPKEVLRRSDPSSGIFESNYDRSCFLSRADSQFLSLG